MAWSLVGVGSLSTVTTSSQTLSEPAGCQEGDLLVAVISSRIASTTSVTLPSGWTRVTENKTNNTLTTGNAASSGVMSYIVRGASAPALTFTHPATPSVAMGRIVAYRGVNSSSPLDVSTNGKTANSTTSVSVAGFTTTVNNDLIVIGACGGQEAAWSNMDATDPSTASGTTDTTTQPTIGTWIERADNSTTTGADTSLAIFDAIKQTTGATGNFTATASVAAAHVILAGAFKMLPDDRYRTPIIVSQAVMRSSTW